MIVNEGMDDIAVNYIKANYTKVKIGNGGDDTAASQTDLDSVVTSKTVTPSVLGSEIVWTAAFTGSEIGTQGISELGVFHASSDKLLSRVTFSNTGVVASSDTVTFTLRVVVN